MSDEQDDQINGTDPSGAAVNDIEGPPTPDDPDHDGVEKILAVPSIERMSAIFDEFGKDPTLEKRQMLIEAHRDVMDELEEAAFHLNTIRSLADILLEHAREQPVRPAS